MAISEISLPLAIATHLSLGLANRQKKCYNKKRIELNKETIVLLV